MESRCPCAKMLAYCSC